MAGKIGGVHRFLGLRTDTVASKCPPEYSPDCSDMIFQTGSAETRTPFLLSRTLPTEIVYRKEFLAKNGTLQVLALDILGNLYVVHEDGTYTIIDTVAPGSKCNSVTAYGREYMAFFNNQGGCDAPRQWDGKNLYRVSQGGPGASPIFAATAITGDTYPISTITQPAPHTWGYSYFLQSSGPGATDSGNVVTIYYSDSTVSGPDADLLAAMASGFPVYMRVEFDGTPQPLGPWTVQITGVGVAQPPGQPRSFYYFTFNLPTTAPIYYAGSGHPGYAVTYQRTLATMTTTVPVPGLEVGDVAAISGSSLSGYDGNQTITQTLDAAELDITQTSITAGVATYHYTVVTGVPPVAGQLVTITDTLNANGALNGSNLSIGTASGGTTGTFTINFVGVADYPNTLESGTGETAGTQFDFDPGAAAVGTTNNPIIGNATGGTLTFGGSTSTVAPGTRMGACFFITDTDDFTWASPPVKFTVPENSNAIAFSNLPIGPANVKARGLMFTAANGGKFFYLPEVPRINGEVLGTSTLINNNTQTNGTVYFSDLALQSGLGMDIPGNNLFAQVALNTPRGVNWYADRMLWIGEKNTVIGFNNLGMDGGTLAESTAPLGWTQLNPGDIQQLGFMPVYSVTGPNNGELLQPAARTSMGAPMLQSLLNYTFRFWMDGTGSHEGTFKATLISPTTGFQTSAIFDLADLGDSGYYSADFADPMPTQIPEDLTLSISFVGLVGTARVRDLQFVYADNPNRNPLARFSYVKNPGAYDSLTGNAGPNDDPGELLGTFIFGEELFFQTTDRLHAITQIGNAEPSSWVPQFRYDKCGPFDANSTVKGTGWAAWGGPNGAFWFTGGIPDKVTGIIRPNWLQIAGITNVFDDPKAERVYFGTIDTLGNKKLLVYDYHEVLLEGPGKWCPWNRPVNWISSSIHGTTFTIGRQFFTLSDTQGIDDDVLGSIGGYYITGPIAQSAFRNEYQGLFLQIDGDGPLTPFVYLKTLQDTPKTLSVQELENLSDVVGEWDQSNKGRLMYLKLGQEGVRFNIQDITAVYQLDPNAPVSGQR